MTQKHNNLLKLGNP